MRNICGPIIHEHHIGLLCCTTASANVFLNLIRKALRFYGLEDRKPIAFENFDPQNQKDVLFIDLTGLNSRVKKSLLNFMRRACEHGVTVIISGFRFGVNVQQQFLNELFKSSSITIAQQSSSNGTYLIDPDSSQITGVLAGGKIPWNWDNCDWAPYFVINKDEFSPLIFGYDNEGNAYPYVVRRVKNGASLFLVAEIPISPKENSDPSLPCPSIIAALLLVRYSASSLCWHNDHLVSNFTIDDPNLVEPYGNLSFKSLLTAMEQWNFKTTIAFIPWNYNRTHRRVVDIFASNPHCFSLAIHGNDHDGYEFYKYEPGDSDPFPVKPLKRQKKSVAQALVRMQLLKKKIGLDFSRVMVFPYGIGTRESIDFLDHYGYLASVNWQLVPINCHRPKRFDFGMRPAEDGVKFFPLCQRWNPDEIIPELQAFFGKPLLVYTHESYFKHPRTKLKEDIDKINRLRPRWLDLDGVIKNLYLRKDENDVQSHIWMFSREIEFVNDDLFCRKLNFYRYENDPGAFRVWCNGERLSAEMDSNCIVFHITVKPKQKVNVWIEKDVLPLPKINPKSNIRISARRYVFEFRDRYWSIWKNYVMRSSKYCIY